MNPSIARLAAAKTTLNAFSVPPRPELPDEVLKRFPVMKDWMAEDRVWREQLALLVRKNLESLEARISKLEG